MFGNENFPLPARADLPYGWKLGTTRKPGGDWGGRLSDMAEVLDLVVVGGGINGAGIARDAAGRGLSVLLCEQSDLASATSSASTKLIHGGLRYLEYYEFRLVRAARSEERRVGKECVSTSRSRVWLYLIKK